MMKNFRCLFSCLFLLFASEVSAQEVLEVSAQEVVQAPQVVAISTDDSAADILAKAANIRASARQLAFHQEEFIAFIHFGPNTFTGVEWGSGKENATAFNPQQVDTDQWCRAMVAAGMKKVVLTVKHHDGYCTWQTRYNSEFSVKQSPWKNGQGDVLKLLAASAQKYGIKLAVYLSPADLFQLESKTGLYGNLSKPQDSIIPTDPTTFKTNPLQQRKVKAGLPTFSVKCDDYNRYFMNQLYELLTEYGPIHEVWFDGAHPKRKGGQTYIKPQWYSMIRQLQPQAVIFGGPDIRWCGNEHGGTRETEWNVLGIESLAMTGKDRVQQAIGLDENLTRGDYDVYGKKFKNNYLYYLATEVNTSIRHGWFWRNDTEQRVKTADEIFDVYERGVGSGGVFLLNIPPNPQGRFSPRDVACLEEVGRRVVATYGLDLAAGAKADVSGLLDGNMKTYWQTPAKQATCIVDLPQPRRFNRLVLQEAVSEVGQRTKKHAIDAWVDGDWKQIVSGTTIGYKKILRFPAVETKRIRIRILDARAPAAIATMSAHFYAVPLGGVVLKRDQAGTVRLTSKDSEAAIRYTLDGSTPDEKSPAYTKPFAMPKGGLVKAACFAADDIGPVLEQRLGLITRGWKVWASSNQLQAVKAIDGEPKTFWHTSWEKQHPVHPHTLTVELPQSETLSGFTYLPRQDRQVPDGMIEQGFIEVSNDGKAWQQVCEFTFGNLVNSPDQRTQLFEQPVSAEFVRLTSTKGAAGKPSAAVAEFGLLAE